MSVRTVVLTGVGRDRTGIVAEITGLLFRLGCNLLDSSMTLLRGEFALILMAELAPQLTPEKLKQELSPVENRLGMQIAVRELTADELKEPPADENCFIISVYGADRTGIVSGITAALAGAKLNITDVQTKSAGEGEHQLFIMIIEVSAPAEITANRLQDILGKTAGELGVDLSIQPVEAAEL